MSTKSDILNILANSTGKYISGQEIATSLNLSRNAIWKAIEALKEEGYPVESRSRHGYRLARPIDMLSKEMIAGPLDFDCEVIVKEQVDSTNTLAKTSFASAMKTSGPSDEAVEHKPLLVVANAQTAGRGRLGRSFYSPADTGVYMSYAFSPKFDMSKSSLVTVAAAVAVAEAMEEVVKKSPKIKWVNDLYLKDKKIAGILTEASMNLEGGQIDSIVIGIGLNCFTEDFPQFENNVPGCIETDVEYTRNQLISSIACHLHRILEEMDSKLIIFEYKTRCSTLGKAITIYREYNNPNEIGVKARAIDIDDNGGLIVEYQGDMSGKLYTITSGEISIR